MSTLLDSDVITLAIQVAKDFGYKAIADIIVLNPATKGSYLLLFAQKLTSGIKRNSCINRQRFENKKRRRVLSKSNFSTFAFQIAPLENCILDKDLSLIEIELLKRSFINKFP